MQKWCEGALKTVKRIWECELFDDVKRLVKTFGKPLLGDLAVTGMTKIFFLAHDWITHEPTAHWVIYALYIAEQIGILVYFLAFSLSDIIESVTSFIVRTKKTLAKSAKDIKTKDVPPSEVIPNSTGIMPGYKVSAINEDVEQKIGQEHD